MPKVAHLILILLGFCTVTRAQKFLLDVSRVRPVLSSIMRCQNFSTLHVAVVQEGADPQTLRLRLTGNSVEDIANDNQMLQIGSVSKGMFGTALPLIEQRLRQERRDPNFNLLSTPLKQLLGDDFWFLDHSRTEQVTLEDLVSHTCGLERHELLWLARHPQTVAETARFASRLTPTLPFRASFRYNNLAFAVAEAALQNITGQTFEQLMRSSLWQPLGMTRTRTAAEMQYPDTDISKSLELMGAAGGIVLPLDDMIKYMQYHISNYNVSNGVPPPKYFSSINAHPIDIDMAGLFTHQVLADSVTNLPHWESHAYGYGWMKMRYRENLDYFHGGAFFHYWTMLSIFSQKKLAVFSNSLFGDSDDSNAQTLHLILLSKYLADMLLMNDSFINEGNACSLLRSQPTAAPAVLRLRHLTDRDVSVCTGSFGNYGLGTVSVDKDAASGDLTARYGIATMRLIPLMRGDTDSTFEFFVNVVTPKELSTSSLILDRNSSHLTLAAQPTPETLLTVVTGAASVNLTSGVLQRGLVMQKELDPATWQRPQLCPQSPNAAALHTAAVCLQLLPAAVAVLTAVSLC